MAPEILIIFVYIRVNITPDLSLLFSLLLCFIWDKVFKNGASEISARWSFQNLK